GLNDLEIGAGAEDRSLLSRRVCAEDTDPDIRVCFQSIDSGFKPLRDIGVHGVARLGAVEGEYGDPVGSHVLNRCGHLKVRICRPTGRYILCHVTLAQPLPADMNWFAVLHHHATRTPDKAITIFEGSPVSYAEMAERSAAFAGGLADRGVGRGDVVGLLSY